MKEKFLGRRRAAHTTARGLAYFSFALGITELLAAHPIARALGLPESLVRAYGAREIATGLGILASPRRAPWVWARVAGDALDVATIVSGSGGNGAKALALGAVAGATMADVANAAVLSDLEWKDRQEWRDYSSRSGFPKGLPSGLRARSEESLSQLQDPLGASGETHVMGHDHERRAVRS
jgi:peptidyl-tRNA hydrolase